jgi:hypothetical protein
VTYQSNVERVIFENLRINGDWVTGRNSDKFFGVDSETTEDIRFIRTENYDPYLAHRPGYVRSNHYSMDDLGAGAYPVDFHDPSDPANYGWMDAGDTATCSVDLPETGLFEIKVSVASGPQGAACRVICNHA